jgi:hypothetical protein
MKSADLLSQRVKVAWQADRLRQLGPSQKHRLGAWLAVDREKNGDDALTVPALEGMLEMLETYFPEEIIGAPQFQAQEAAIISAHAKA